MRSLLVLPLLSAPLAEGAGANKKSGTCGEFKELYKKAECCGNPDKAMGYIPVPQNNSKSMTGLFGKTNPCMGKKPIHSDTEGTNGYFNNIDCWKNGVVQAVEQAGGDITKGKQGTRDPVGADGPITDPYWKAGLCPVNVHWHLGAEHRSEGEFDEAGKGPENTAEEDEDGEKDSRRLETARLGHRCHYYDETDERYTVEYNWKHCEGMHVGETYEVHWPHSAAGMCNTPFQYQTPFYDGVFCTDGIITLDPLNTYKKIGVQGQVFTIINDEDYYYPDLFRGWIHTGDFAKDVAYYTGSTTGTSRNNQICSQYAPITWQVDRKCHLISASSFDKMCADMKNQYDDMTTDTHAHGARETVWANLTASNIQRRLYEV